VPPLSQRLLDLPQLRAHAIPSGLPPDLEITPPGLRADQHKAQELEGLRLATPALLAVLRRKAAELDQPGLARPYLFRDPDSVVWAGCQPLAGRCRQSCLRFTLQAQAPFPYI
jgi:hypothetical protein